MLVLLATSPMRTNHLNIRTMKINEVLEINRDLPINFVFLHLWEHLGIFQSPNGFNLGMIMYAT